jgi:hypothetical protein
MVVGIRRFELRLVPVRGRSVFPFKLDAQVPVVAGLPVPRLDFRYFKPSENGCLSSAKHTSRMPEVDPLPDLNRFPDCVTG